MINLKKVKEKSGEYLSEEDKIIAINLMADSMEEGAKYSGPGLHCISGDKIILAERALNSLLKHFKISK